MAKPADLEPIVSALEAGWAVHNLHAPAVLVDAKGTYTHDGEHRIPAPTPLHIADTREAAEAWRHHQETSRG